MTIRQIEPKERPVSLEGMYLRHNLQELAERTGRPIVVANYVTDLRDVIAVKGVRGSPEKLQNPSDWRLFQEVNAQADVIITGAGYMSEFMGKDESTQNVLTQFEKGGSFEDLGDWRERNGLKRSPDIVIVSRSLNFRIPKSLSESRRRIIIYTTNLMQGSKKARELEKTGASVIEAGRDSVDGAGMVERLSKEGYMVIKMTTGPRVLKLLMDAEFKNQKGEVIRRGALDRLYITRVDRTITDDLSNAVMVLEGRKVDDLSALGGGYQRIERYVQDSVSTHDGFETSQEFFVYETNDLI